MSELGLGLPEISGVYNSLLQLRFANQILTFVTFIAFISFLAGAAADAFIACIDFIAFIAFMVKGMAKKEMCL